MTDFFNIHTHTLVHPEREILSQSPCLFTTDGQMRHASIGIHPWLLTEENADTQWKALRQLVSHPSVIAIGEGGLDKLKGASMNLQIDILKKQVALSEEKALPLVLHCVRAFNELILLKKELKPRQPWVIHGFRGKETLAMDCIRHGFYLSFGEHFHHEALKATPKEKLFIETDESETPIESIYRTIAEIRETPLEELKECIKKNVNEVFFKP